MPQNPNAATVAKNLNNQQVALKTDAVGALQTAAGGVSTALNVIAATVVKTGAGRVCRIFVNTAGSAAGTVSDVATTGGVAAANLIANIPATAGVITLDAPFSTGLVITPGTGQVLSVSYL